MATLENMKAEQVAEARAKLEALSARLEAARPREPGAALLDDTVAAIRRHIVLPAESADVVALWIGHTWVYERFDHSPRLAITSPVAACGKSVLLDCIASICCAPVKTDNVTPAVMFRLIEAKRPRLTILADEYDTYISGNEELRGILNSGFERSGAVFRAERKEDGGFDAVEFHTYAPVALSGIRKLPPTIASRSLPILLQRKAKDDRVEKLRAKALHFRLIGLPGRVVSHARKLIIRLGGGAEALASIVTARQTIRALACGPAG